MSGATEKLWTAHVRVALASAVLGVSGAVSAQGMPHIVSEQALLDAISGERLFSETQLSQLDLNADARVDVADLNFFLSDAQIPLSGYKWIVSVYSDAGAQTLNSLSHEYSFVLVVDGATGTVGTLDELSPIKGLLRQSAQLPMPGDCPGDSRPDYAPTVMIPVGTTFAVATGANNFDLTGASVQVPADDPTNPIGNVLIRSWTLNISTAAAFSDEFYHGSMTESLVGVLPGGQAIDVSGNVRLTRYSKSVLEPLDDASSPQNLCAQ